MSRRAFTEDQEKQVIAEYASGRSLREIGAAHGAGVRAVTGVLERHGVTRRPAVRPRRRAEKTSRRYGRGARDLLPEQRQEIAARFLNGETQTAIGERFACCASTIARVLREEGVPAGAHGQMREHHHNWQGGRRDDGHGYIQIRPERDDEIGQVMKALNGYVLEHRLVMAHHLGRPLTPEETVHHGPGGKLDNRIENLELWASRHPKGQRVEELVAFAREILALYGDLPPAVVA